MRDELAVHFLQLFTYAASFWPDLRTVRESGHRAGHRRRPAWRILRRPGAHPAGTVGRVTATQETSALDPYRLPRGAVPTRYDVELRPAFRTLRAGHRLRFTVQISRVGASNSSIVGGAAVRFQNV